MGYFVSFLAGMWSGIFLLAILSAGSDADQ
jgi:hypothetical protein